MNNQLKEVLSEQTKERLLDFFITSKISNQKYNSKKYFEKLLTQKDKYKDRDWDYENTIVNYLLSHNDFNLTNTKLDQLYVLNQDWSCADKNSENTLFFLIKKQYDFYKIIEIIQKMNINYQQKNIENLYFVNYFLNKEPIEEIVSQFERGINNFPEIRLNKYFINYLQVIEYFPELIQETIEVEKNKFEDIKKILNQEKGKKFNQNSIGINLDDTLSKVEKTLMYFSLDNKLSAKNIKNKKSKI